MNTYNQAVPNEVAYLFNAVTLNNIVDSNGNTNVIATKQELNEKSTVIANPTLSGDEPNLEGAEIDGIKYKVGGGSEVHLYEHIIRIKSTFVEEKYVLTSVILDSSTPFTVTSFLQWLFQNHSTSKTALFANGTDTILGLYSEQGTALSETKGLTNTNLGPASDLRLVDTIRTIL